MRERKREQSARVHSPLQERGQETHNMPSIRTHQELVVRNIKGVLQTAAAATGKRRRRRKLQCHHRCWVSSTAYGYPNKDYRRRDGVVEGVWIFSRHGDRVPGRCLSPEHRRNDEAAFWISKLPYPDSASAFETFSTRFPLEIHPGFNQGKFIDVARNPFGFLTRKGLEQLNENGHRFFDRYNKHGHHFPDQKQWRWEVAEDFLSVWNVKVYSTNYLRTVMSVQSLLDGLLGTNLLPPFVERPFDPQIHREDRVPNHMWGKPTDPLVQIQVRDVSNDPLNAFDRNPDLIADLVAEVMDSPAFFKGDNSAAPLAARLANILPGLVRPRSGGAGGTSDFSTRSPSGINWVEAADHFVCRMAHGVQLAQFSDHENDPGIEETLAAMAHPTTTHLAWRFRQWYQNERLLAVIAAPVLREVLDQVLTTLDLRVDERHPFVIYSCHDITLLGLLYAIGADFLGDDQRAGWRFWPQYGSTITFELVRIQEEGEEEEENGADSHVVRILLNGQPVITAEAHKTSKGRIKLVYTGSGPENMLHVHDFDRIVTQIEDRGGFDYASLLNLQQ